ncbi:red family protein n-terminal region [Cystoisospora suis]|uniref:Red family protein n-terminal region n=1 Tax=Cystoisospora suis TaxID=483139 RepID=A0A2C6KRE0_9APIC|nr:red family protein n-terminal region [Cystoisospora suis]
MSLYHWTLPLKPPCFLFSFRKKQTSAVDPEERAQRRQEKNQKRRERYLEILKRRQKHKEGQQRGKDHKGGGEEDDDGSNRHTGSSASASGMSTGLGGGSGSVTTAGAGSADSAGGIPMPTRYKDRAEERRKGKDEIYQQAAEELQEMKERSVEESKYLGGDLEHTHLVKGLDFALLSKVRNELEKEEQKKLQKQQEEEAERKRNREQRRLHIYTPFGRRLFHAFFDNLHPHQTRFQENLRRLELSLISVCRSLQWKCCYLYIMDGGSTC